MKRILLSLPVAVMAASLLSAAPAHADDRTCRGTIGAVSIDGSVIVPQGATCALLGTRVDGNVLVKSAAKLVAKGVKVGGSIQAENHKSVVVTPRIVNDNTIKSRVIGDVQMVSGGPGEIRRAVIGGSLQTKQNDGRQVAVRNIIDSDLQAFTNIGGVHISRNMIDGNLQCKSNNPPPTGGGNKVQGNKEDQCSKL